MLKRSLDAVESKRLRNRYASYLLEQPSFCTWLLIAQEDAEVWPWFESFLKVTMKEKPSKQFDVACRKVMAKLIEFAKPALEKRWSTAVDLFEYRLFHFFVLGGGRANLPEGFAVGQDAEHLPGLVDPWTGARGFSNVLAH